MAIFTNSLRPVNLPEMLLKRVFQDQPDAGSRHVVSYECAGEDSTMKYTAPG